MNRAGLLAEPIFDNPDYYLGEGELTKKTDFIEYISSKINGETDGERIRNLIVWINKNIPRKEGQRDPRKFNKTAEDIINDKIRTGCSDSCILFSTIARAMEIPTIQIITFDKDWGEEVEKGKETNGTRGHFYCGVYIKDINGKADWILIDSDAPVSEKDKVVFRKLDRSNRSVSQRRYAFAYVRDFRDITVDGIKIDSIEHMAYVQRKAAKEALKNKEGIEI